MKSRNRKIFFILLLTGSIIAGYYLWLSIRPVKIIAVHQQRNFSDVLVKSFPFTDKGKINWWLENKDILERKYGIPRPASYGTFSITFWLFGEGYKVRGDYDDLLCFEDMNAPKNCIEKDAVFTVDNDREGRIYFTVYDGTYLLQENGEVIKDTTKYTAR